MFTLGYRLRPWTAPRAIADGASILRYIRDTAEEAGIVPGIRFGHAVRRAEWSTADAAWTVHGERLADGAPVVWRARFLYVCAGYYSYAEGHRPISPARPTSAARSSTRSSGPKASTSPASASSSSAAARPR
jgi:cyclohexanone monooxygenase